MNTTTLIALSTVILFTACTSIIETQLRETGTITGGTVVPNEPTAKIATAQTGTNHNTAVLPSIPDSISLYLSNNLQNVIQTIALDNQGRFSFTDLEFNTYSLKIKNSTLGGVYNSIVISDSQPDGIIDQLPLYTIRTVTLKVDTTLYAGLYDFEKYIPATDSGILTYPYIQIINESITNQQYISLYGTDGTLTTRTASFGFWEMFYDISATPELSSSDTIQHTISSSTSFSTRSSSDNSVPASDPLLSSNASVGADSPSSAQIVSPPSLQGSILYTNRFLRHAIPEQLLVATCPQAAVDLGLSCVMGGPVITEGDLLTSLYDNEGNDLLIDVGDTLKIDAYSYNTSLNAPTLIIVVTDSINPPNQIQLPTDLPQSPYFATAATLDNLATALNIWFDAEFPGGTATFTSSVNDSIVGALRIDAGEGVSIIGLSINSHRPISDAHIVQAFTFPFTIDQFNSPGYSNSFYHDVSSNSLLKNSFDRNAQPLGLQSGDFISVNTTIGGNSSPASHITYTDSTTMQDLMNGIAHALSLPYVYDTSVATPKPSLSIGVPSDEGIAMRSAIIIRGKKGTQFKIENLNITASNSNNLDPTPKLFNANMATESFQEAVD